MISIHAPREGSDIIVLICKDIWVNISIHAPREGSDKMDAIKGAIPMIFLSTLPVRGATLEGTQDAASRMDFYPRSP